jgi:hypothetical protein
MTALADDRAIQLKRSLNETEAERERADQSATRLAGMLERSILENAWTQALNGDADGSLIISDRSARVSYLDIEQQRQIPIRDFEPAITQTIPLDSGELLILHFNGRINWISQQDISCRLAHITGLAGFADGVCLGDSAFSLTGHEDGILKRWNTTTGALEN